MRKFLKFILKTLLILLIVAAIGNIIVFAISGPKIRKDVAKLEHADCILVLGSSVNPDGTPGDHLEKRLDTAISLYMQGYADKLLLSGDNGQVEYNEVGVMKDYVIMAGVPESDVFLDHAGFSTYESMYRAKAIFAVESAIVVTQRFHLDRALASGTILGMKVQGYAAPNADSSLKYQIYMQAREFLARDKDLVMALLKLEPTYLGEVIPITGDGRLSWD